MLDDHASRLPRPTENGTGREPPAPPGPLLEFWRQFSANRGALLGLGIIGLLAILALTAPWLAPHPPDEQYRNALLLPPAWLLGGNIISL